MLPTPGAEIEVTCTPSNAVPPDETPSTLGAEIEVACTPSNAVLPDEMLPTPAAETDLACPPSNAVPLDEMPSMPTAETDLACPPSNVVLPVEEAEFCFTPPVSFFSVYYIVEVVLILLTTFIYAFMHWCQYEVRHFFRN